MNISMYEAEALACELIAVLGAASHDDFALLREKTVATDDGWVFFYNSREFIETGDPISALAGNGPIFVSKNGEVRQLPSALPWEQAIRSI
jgi:hypothetical protein